jgi:tRNA threonylcarbamoyladenosine biosynthesis protein TsaE
MKEIKTESAQETVELGRKLGMALRKGDIVCLTGNLGVGKTAFTGGIAAGLGIKGYITSPTFTIVNEYKGRLPLYHFDVYRITDPSEMFEIGFEEYLEGSGVVVIEWADIVKELIPNEHIHVEIKKDPKGNSDARTLLFDFGGKKYKDLEDYFA